MTLPSNRFYIRPDIDPSDKEAVEELAGAIADWIIAHRDRVQQKLAAEKKALIKDE